MAARTHPSVSFIKLHTRDAWMARPDDLILLAPKCPNHKAIIYGFRLVSCRTHHTTWIDSKYLHRICKI